MDFLLKKIVSVVLIFVLSIIAVSSVVSASEISIYTLYTSSCNSTLTTSGTTATCTSKATGYLGETTKIIFNQTLQKKSSSGAWNNFDSWSETVYSYKGSVSNTKYSLSSGTYRLKTVFTVYAGTNSEEITKYSSEKTI